MLSLNVSCKINQMKKINQLNSKIINFFFFSFFILTGCEKPEKPTNLTLSQFVAKTQSLIINYEGIAKQIDFTSTKLVSPGPGQFFHTSLAPSEHLARALISIVRSDRKVLQFIIVVDKIAEEITYSRIFSIGGSYIGGYRIQKGKVYISRENLESLKAENINQEIFDDMPPPEKIFEPIEELRSWWRCTQECISDCHIACFMDSECATMLMVTNIGGIAARKPGIGSLSINISCGISCAFNSNLDLLPKY